MAAASAPLVLTDAFLSLDAVDVSNDLKQVTIKFTSPALDITTMGSGAQREFVKGLADSEITAEFIQDYTDGGIDATLFGLVFTGEADIVIRPTAAAAGTGNPEYTFTAQLTSYDGPVKGEVGDVAMTSVTFKPSGTIARGTGA